MFTGKKINKEELIKKGMKRIEKYKLGDEVCEIVKEELKKIDGKKITKRVATNIEKALNKKINEGFRVGYNKDDMWYRISIWNSNIRLLDYDNKIIVMISPRELDSDKTYNHDKFINDLGRLGSWNEQISDIEKDLELIKNSNIIEEYNKACDLIENTRKSFDGLRCEF